jgi:ribosome-binding factor A
VRKGAFWSLVGVSAVLGLFAMGCGGGSDDSTATFTKAQFVQKGNALCKKREEERAEQVQVEVAKLKPGGEFSDAKQTKMVVTIIEPSYEKIIADVKSLGSPDGQSAEVAKIVKSMEDALKKLEAKPEEAVFNTLMFEEANKLATEYGLSSCVI